MPAFILRNRFVLPLLLLLGLVARAHAEEPPRPAREPLFNISFDKVALSDVADSIAEWTHEKFVIADGLKADLTVRTVDAITTHQIWEVWSEAFAAAGIAVERKDGTVSLSPLQGEAKKKIEPLLAGAGTVVGRFPGSERELAIRVLEPLLSPHARVVLLDADLIIISDVLPQFDRIRRVMAALHSPDDRPDLVALEFASHSWRRIVQTSPGTYHFPKGELDTMLGNVKLIATEQRLVPTFKNGVAIGFKLYAIRPHSLVHTLGFENGDVITAVNGMPLTSPEQDLEVYSHLMKSTRLEIEFVRKGETRKITCEFERAEP